MDISEDIKTAIRSQLPAAVGTELQEILKEYAAQKEAIVDADRKIEELRIDLSIERDAIVARDATIDNLRTQVSTEAQLDLREESLNLREAVIDLREQHAAEKVSLLQTTVGQVFASNKLNYGMQINGDLSGSIPMGKDQYGSDYSGFFNAGLKGGAEVTKEE